MRRIQLLLLCCKLRDKLPLGSVTTANILTPTTNRAGSSAMQRIACMGAGIRLSSLLTWAAVYIAQRLYHSNIDGACRSPHRAHPQDSELEIINLDLGCYAIVRLWP